MSEKQNSFLKNGRVRTCAPIFVVACLFCAAAFSAVSLSSAAEPGKLTLLDQDWREKNPLDREAHRARMRAIYAVHVKNSPRDEERLRKMLGYGANEKLSPEDEGFDDALRFPGGAKSINLPELSKVFWNDAENEKIGDAAAPEFYLKGWTFETNSIPGYSLIESHDVSFVFAAPTDDVSAYDVSFKIEPEQFANPTEATPQGENRVRALVFRYKNKAEAKTIALRYVLGSGSMPCYMYLQWSEVEGGPGEICLVGAGKHEKYFGPQGKKSAEKSEDPRSDQIVLFVRGNVAIELSSNSSFSVGCIDLARRLDDFLLEQAEKQKAEK